MSNEESPPILGPTTQQKKEFREYLHKSGIVDTMMRLLAVLYETKERPTDETQVENFIKKHIGELVGVDIESMVKENEQLRAQVSDLKKRCAELESALS